MTMIAPHNPEAPQEPAAKYDPMGSLREWHEATDSVRYSEEKDAWGRKRNISLRAALIREEHKETQDELLDLLNGCGDRVKLAKELADLLYVVYGTADDFEIPLDAVFNAVHASNMTKVGADGKVQRRGDGKILKGPNYVEPDIASVILPGVAS
jgi:NTP pyrophosphatase (non-canonical NTP hydrolase)